MTTEPFMPPPDADPADGTAPIVPVTPEMMDHAAREAAERADAVAHDAPETAPAPAEEMPEAVAPAPEPVAAPAAAESSAPANENAAAAASEAIASGTLQAADLAFTHGRSAADATAERAALSAAGSIGSLGLYNAKLLEIAAANLSATGEFVSALLKAKSVPEAAAINADHIRRRLDALTMQGRELLLLAQKVAFDAMRPSGDGSRKP